MNNRTRALCKALADGVTADITLQARYGLWPAYSEYLIYAPIVAIARRLGWAVSCEHKLPKNKIGKGDNPRLDFLFTHSGTRIAVAMEVKRSRDPKKVVSVKHDVRKLHAVLAPKGIKIDAKLILIAGPHEIGSDGKISLRSKVNENLSVKVVRGLGVGKSAWGTTIYELQEVHKYHGIDRA